MKFSSMSYLSMAVAAVAAVTGLAGCASNQASVVSTAPTAPMKVNVSTPTLAAGYVKVAAAPGAALYFVNLKNGDTVASPVLIQFGLRGMGVAPAGVEKAGTGHHHLLIDVPELDVNAPIAVSDQLRHFGLGQTEVTLEMKPGQHTLQLLMGDQNHIPHHPVVMSERITITVK
jgi:Domain of unknown function (DUF4399)